MTEAYQCVVPFPRLPRRTAGPIARISPPGRLWLPLTRVLRRGPHRQKSLPQTLTLDHVSPATRLLEKRRQMFEVCSAPFQAIVAKVCAADGGDARSQVQEALDAQKEEFARREVRRPLRPRRAPPRCEGATR